MSEPGRDAPEFTECNSKSASMRVFYTANWTLGRQSVLRNGFSFKPTQKTLSEIQACASAEKTTSQASVQLRKREPKPVNFLDLTQAPTETGRFTVPLSAASSQRSRFWRLFPVTPADGRMAVAPRQHVSGPFPDSSAGLIAEASLVSVWFSLFAF